MDYCAPNRAYKSFANGIRSVTRVANQSVTSRADVAAFIADELEKNGYVPQAVFVASRRK